MALETYREKRDFKVTPEPRGKKARREGHSFVIQKHAARRLHYDFRLELGGVLVSWAVTKGPSLVPGEKRLAVHVEDHPLDYGGFEGTIPKGEYGGGAVIVWDKGTWAPVGDAEKGLKKGHLEFELVGEKLRGRWHLVRMAGKPGEKRENWLLIKGDDAAARGEGDPDILEERPESVLTGRQVEDVAGEEPGWSSKKGRLRDEAGDASALKGAKKGKMPDFVAPALATLMAKPPSGVDWIHEIKFDGYRLQLHLADGKVWLVTRGGLDWTEKFGGNIVKALKAIPAKNAIIDGELVVETGAGASDFSALQADLSARREDRFLFYAFDLLYLDGYDLRTVPLLERKAALEKLVEGRSESLRYSAHFGEDGGLVLRHACRLSLEGIVSKKADAPYRSGRGKSWIKSKCAARQEFVIGGYVPSSTTRQAIGSLVLGVYEEGKLRHVGRVGTGFSHAVAGELMTRLEAMRVTESPFAGKLTADEARQVRYVKPDLVAEIEFRAWTADGHLRHAAFRGLREDKPAGEITREVPAAEKAEKAPRRRVALTHPDRVYWPDEGVTKEGLADYYTEVWRWMAPHVTGRALALLRCPEGIGGEKFFQKHAWRGINRHIRLIPDPRHKEDGPLVSIADLDGLIGLVQGAVLEIHPWGSSIAQWEKPDRIIMDLDPGEDVAWESVIAAALEVKKRLEKAGLAAFLKTSGGKGLHVVSPLKPRADWVEVKAFTKGIAEAMAADSPGEYVSIIAKAKRRGKILIDYLRNQRGQTAVAPYSTRARPGAAVSMPLAWEELDAAIGPAYFTVKNAPARLSGLKADPWEDFAKRAVALKG
jgi:bifunctional non-homologous end joining protein LigD